MANSGANTNGSQFFIVAGSQGESLAPNYTLFGQGHLRHGRDRQDQPGGSSSGTPTTLHRMVSVTVTESS